MIRGIVAFMARPVAGALAAMLALCLALTAGAAAAQSGRTFSPVAYVNDRAITNYELQQRMTVLQLFGTPGDLRELALEQLIDDRLRLAVAAQFEVVPTQEQVAAGLEEFAGRANLDVETFLGALAERGVSEETMRDFVRAGLAWREVVQGLYGARAQVSEAEVDRVVAVTVRQSDAEVELAEIRLPAGNQADLAKSEVLANELQQTIQTPAGFAKAARRYSIAPNAENGGRDEAAKPLGSLPEAVRTQVITLSPGQITEPVQIGNTLSIFQLLALRETALTEAEPVAIEYAEYLIPGGRSEAALNEAAKVAGRVDSCDDLYGINLGQPPERLVRYTRPLNEVPADVARELAALDAGEVSTALTRGSNLVLLMVCERVATLDPADVPSREAIRRRLFAQRLAAYGDAYLAELKADAIIRYP
ncbi:peptidylprolyl isomerase [Tropicimonas sp. IMCC6043]|uniref:peptidylprolyl isomerase n=1 Tax=Tropicimonas sp. IMCC6043 TaxID=2510645 RepID=UPI00101D88BC|nr:peptidylprolyl isomerase [Tropicimonas sp. IMCC6043]RYH11216.1 peptidylprolyl isomerase [Tropicimonas sp. IMCC6043]